MDDVSNNVFGWFALSSAISMHLLSKHHDAEKAAWYSNSWFWAGFFGNLPALIAFSAHLWLSRGRGEAPGG